MALFHLIAQKEGTELEWGGIYPKIDTLRYECITVFPISKAIGSDKDALGITASAKFSKKINQVIEELTILLKLLWDSGFQIYDLYKGDIVTETTLKEVMDYL